ncbi:unnamed protein product [Pleuronectes platessa]|uniref:Uncharacterized protein n=1 Tax=Pleuronectes platessa TaxID=8262 RepID=A0A9N7YA74_PLEPL|nr:unnamed protein product [Pleuronectes platessa]
MPVSLSPCLSVSRLQQVGKRSLPPSQTARCRSSTGNHCESLMRAAVHSCSRVSAAGLPLTSPVASHHHHPPLPPTTAHSIQLHRAGYEMHPCILCKQDEHVCEWEHVGSHVHTDMTVPDALGKKPHDKWQKVRAPRPGPGACCPCIPLPVSWHAACQAKWQPHPPSTLTFKTSAMLSSCGHRRSPILGLPRASRTSTPLLQLPDGRHTMITNRQSCGSNQCGIVCNELGGCAHGGRYKSTLTRERARFTMEREKQIPNCMARYQRRFCGPKCLKQIGNIVDVETAIEGANVELTGCCTGACTHCTAQHNTTQHYTTQRRAGRNINLVVSSEERRYSEKKKKKKS